MLRAHKSSERRILTINGELKFVRKTLRPVTKEDAELLYKLEQKKTIIPLDIALGIDKLPFKISLSLMLELAYFAINLDSYEEAEEFFSHRFSVRVNDDTMRMIVNTIGKIVYEEDSIIAQETKRKFEAGEIKFPRHKKPGVLYLETDGATLNTRTRNQDGSSWKENKLGMVFTSDDLEHWYNKNKEKCRKVGKREYISIFGSVEDFKYHFLALALRKGYGSYEQTVLLSDGASWIGKLKEEFFPDAQQILDFFHLCENTGKFAQAIYKDPKQVKEQADKWCELLKQGKWESVLKEIEEYKDKSMPGVVNLYGYIYNNRKNIDYPTYIEKGYFIGSGAIESGNKKVVQSRMKLAGMRWNPSTALIPTF